MWQAGIHETKLEIPYGLNMAGYVGRTHGAQGVSDNLYVRCIVLGADDTMAVLISCDLLLLSNDFADSLQKSVAKQLGFQPNQVTICCTHTHSGPGSPFDGQEDPAINNWLEQFAADVVLCAHIALQHMEPCQLTLHTGETDFQVNRVLKAAWGGVNSENWEIKNWDERSENELKQFEIALGKAAENADAMVYRKVLTICVRDASDTSRIIAFLVNCACHPVIYELNNYLYSADFPGAAMRNLEERYHGAVAFFFNGCCGDINPVLRGSKEAVEQIGSRLANSVCESLQVSQPIDGSLSLHTFNVDTAYEVDFGEDEIRRRLSIYNKGYQNAVAENLFMEREIYTVYIAWARKMQALLDARSLNREIHAAVQALSIGSVNIVAMPFEAFTGIGNAIRETLGENTLIFGYANGNYGYLISKAMYPVAKYERFEEYKFAGRPGAIEECAQDRLIEALDKCLIQG